MDTNQEWTTLCHGIDSMRAAFELLPREMNPVKHDADYDGLVQKFLQPRLCSLVEQSRRIFEALSGGYLPSESMKPPTDMLERLEHWTRGGQDEEVEGSCSEESESYDLVRNRQILVGLVGLRAFLEPYIRFTAQATSLTERAFIHLQSLLRVDEARRAKWRGAFEGGETKCETLGAAQLLYHGIWSFKADATGAKTDLVLGEPLNTSDESVRKMKRAAAALVLTEWKLIRHPASETKKQSSVGEVQATIYATGSLAGFALDAVRYVILVSEKRLPQTPGDKRDGGVIYRYINIAIEPDSPSRAARAASRSPGKPRRSGGSAAPQRSANKGRSRGE